MVAFGCQRLSVVAAVVAHRREWGTAASAGQLTIGDAA
jgi:hypothetical protein